MRGGRLLIVLGLIVVLGAVAVGVVLWVRGRVGPEEPAAVVEEPAEGAIYVPPEGMQEIVVAAQNISRGTSVMSDAVKLATWPDAAVPEGALTEADIAERWGDIARVDIMMDMPILESMLTDMPGDLAAVGSDAALLIPPGKVAYALTAASNSSVAWAIQPGDHVDVLISLLLVELDEEFQTILPNHSSCVQPPEGEECQSMVMGRLEVLPNGWVVNLTPGEPQRPRLVTQLTVQNAVVLRVGEWPVEEEEAPPVVEEEPPTEVAVEPASPARAAVEPVTLVVTPQDAMVLKYAEEAGASIDLVLRSAGDEALATTDPVTLKYLFERFDIELPTKLPYGVTPPLQEVQPGATGGLEAEVVGEPVEQ